MTKGLLSQRRIFIQMAIITALVLAVIQFIWSL